MNTQPEIQVHQLTWRLRQHNILNNIAFSLNQGECLGIVGPNGAGKTSLLRCISGAINTFSGEIRFASSEQTTLTRQQLAKKVAVVAQINQPVFDINVTDIVKMGLVPHKSAFEFDTQADQQRIAAILQQLNLLKLQHTAFQTLSGGEQQRVLIAKALVQNTPILLLDEPTNHLDVFYQRQILSLVTNLPKTLIISLHDLNLAAEFCDKILLLAQGEQIAFGSPEQVLTPAVLQPIYQTPCCNLAMPDEAKISQYLCFYDGNES